MKILYVGSVLNSKECSKRVGPSVAGNKMQLGIISGLMKGFNQNIDIITQEPIAAFPKEKKIVIKKEQIEISKNISADKSSFINIHILKQITKAFSTYILIKRWSKINDKDEQVIVCYNAYPEVSVPILLASKGTNIKTICIVADPPIDPIIRGGLSKNIKNMEEKLSSKTIKEFDGLVVLNENVICEYAPKTKYTVVDGGFDIMDTPTSICGGQWINSDPNEILKVIFCGAVIEYNGIINLIKAVKLTKNTRFCLEIYGSGPLVEYVRNSSEKDNRIRYMGIVRNEEMLKIQKNAALLINPRTINDPISKLTFPSKMIEYLLSGVPVVSTKLNGFTDDYLNQMFVFDDDTPESIAKKIDEILLMDPKDLILKSINARKFIVENKSWNVQANKIKKFIESIIN